MISGRPYYAGKEVPREEYFFNRTREIRLLKKALSSQVPTNIAIVGLRRTGKTSLIKKLSKELTNKISLVIKCEKLLPFDELTFFQNLVKELIKKYSSKGVLIKEGLKKTAQKISRVGLTIQDIDFWMDLGKGKAELKEVMDKAFELIEQISKAKQVVVFLDEFQELYVFGDKFLWALRAYIADSSASFVVSSSHHRFLNILQDEGRPFFNFFEITHLKEIDKEDARHYLIKQIKKYGFSYGEGVVDKILEESRLNPFYIQLLGLKGYENALMENKKVIDLDVYNKGFKDCLDNLPAYLLNAYSKLKGRTRDIFVAMCVWDLERPSEIAEKVGLNTSNVSQILKQIEETYGLIKKEEVGYKVVDRFLKEYIKRERG